MLKCHAADCAHPVLPGKEMCALHWVRLSVKVRDAHPTTTRAAQWWIINFEVEQLL